MPPAPATSQSPVPRLRLAIIAIALLALALRLWGISGGLPWVDHPDEPNPVGYAIAMLQTGDRNPHAFQKPTLYVYLLTAVLALHEQVATPALAVPTITIHRFTTVPALYIWGRVLTATLGALSVIAAAWAARRTLPELPGVAIWAALIIATSRFHMQHSQYVTTDVLSALLVLLAFGAALGIVQHGRPRDYLLAGLLAGLAASTKYNAGVAALLVPAAHLARGGWRAVLHPWPLLAAGMAALLGFVAGTPYALLSFGEFRAGLLGQVEAYNDGVQGDLSGRWPLAGYAQFLWETGLTPPLLLATLAGLVLLARRAPRTLAVWLAFVLPYALLLLAQESHFHRNLLPLIVLCAVPGAVAAAALVAAGSRRVAARAAAISRSDFRVRAQQAGMVLLVAGLLLAPAVVASAQYGARLGRGDTRVQLLRWLQREVPPGARIAAELPPLPGPLESPWAAATLPDRDLAWYRAQGYAYLVASSDRWRSWEPPAAYAAFGMPTAQFGGATPRTMFGPRLLVYATGLSATDAPTPIAAARVGGARLVGVAFGASDTRSATPAVALDTAPTEVLALRTFWQVETAFDRDYYIFVHVLDAAGNRVAQRDAPPWQGRYGTSSWQPGTLVVDANDVALGTLPSGEYRVVVGMFAIEDFSRPATSLHAASVDAIEVGRISLP